MGLRDDTIAAIASAPGRAARGIVRVSGPQAWAVVRKVSADPAVTLPRRQMMVGHRLEPSLPCLLLLVPAPQGYTGEDSCEIQLPGNPALLERVLNALIAAGARQAEPGEFTARAYFNGKLTLTQAEGVAATILAASDAQWRAARLLTRGRLASVARELADDLAGALALVEAGIDFTDQEDVAPISPAALDSRLAGLQSRIDDVLGRAVGSERLSALPWVVLTGPPNAGKSTLFNALLGRSRAVVSAAAGTTRDALTEPVRLDPDQFTSPEIMLVDVAGWDESPLGLNPQMQRAARKAVERADLILRLIPAGDESCPGAWDTAAARSGDSRRTILVRSKCDLARARDDVSPVESGVEVSALMGAGMDRLRREIASRLAGRTASLAADALALQPRHERALSRASEHLAAARSLLAPHVRSRTIRDVELVAAEARLALDALGELAGDVTPDEVLGRIFAGFCVGK